MRNFLDDEYILRFSPRLAAKIGLQEAIVIYQFDYWIQKNIEKEQNYNDGFYWTYNTYEKWHEQFPYCHVNTIKNAIKNLEEQGLIITANYNKRGMDRTKWYRVNYERLGVVLNASSESNDENTAIVQKLYDASNNISTMQDTKNVQAIPKTTSKTTSKTNNKDNAPFLSEMACSPSYPNKEVVRAIEEYMTDLYFQKTGKKHPNLKQSQYKNAYEKLCEYGETYDFTIDMMIEYLNDESLYCDWNINHFVSEGILTIRQARCT